MDQISIVMPVKNEQEYLFGAIRSVQDQTYRHWELILVDDNSSDASIDIAEKFEDHRIKIMASEGRGIVAALNTGLSAASSDIVVRFDADDIMLPNRLSHQKAMFESDRRLAVVGSWSRSIIGGRIIRNPVSHDLIGAFLRHGNCMSHPTVAIHRKRLVREVKYNADLESIEDFDLWLRLYFDLGAKFGNSRQVLLRQRVQGSARVVKERLSKARELLRTREHERQGAINDQIANQVFVPWCDLRVNEWIMKRTLLLQHAKSEAKAHLKDAALAYRNAAF